MASSSSSDHSKPASSRSYEYDVFLSFRGEDTRKKFVDHLYSDLNKHLINVYKDDDALPRGEFIGPALFKAIEESFIAVIVFSKSYANSSWCLDELTYIMKCKYKRGLIVIPIFYDVEPTEVRNQKGEFGEAFAAQEAKNATKFEEWRKALINASNISGWEPKNIADGHESQFIKRITDTILDRLFAKKSGVDEDLVGMRVRLKELESLLDIESTGVGMVGIWGVGGGGKTTLASSLYKKISPHFKGTCFVGNVREETSKIGLHKLQENILSALLNKEVRLLSVEEGKDKLKSILCRRNVLIVLDDVNDVDQLEALAGKHDWFGTGSRIIITTRDEQLLKAHRIDKIYQITLLSDDEATKLFNRHAYNEECRIEDYETLSSHAISYADGLPLALKVLGSFLYGRKKNEWKSALDKLKDVPDQKVMKILKISYDGLETYQKELFLDIACFFREASQDYDALDVFKACDFHPEIGIEVLRQKALISINVNGGFDMHDLVQEMGHYIARGNHSRLWEEQEIRDLHFPGEAMEYNKTEAIVYDNYFGPRDDFSLFCKIVQNMKKLRLLIMDMNDNNTDENDECASFVSNELRYIHLSNYPASPFPTTFQPTKLVVLKLFDSMQSELWKGYKHLPHLKVLDLDFMRKLLSTPDFDGIPRLQTLKLGSCGQLEEVHPSLGNRTSLEYLEVKYCPKLKRLPTSISQMKNIKRLIIMGCCLKDGIPCGIGELSSLEELDLSHNNVSRLDFSLSQLTRLKYLDLSYCYKLLEFPELPSSLAILKAYDCGSHTSTCHIVVEDFYKNCKGLRQVSLKDYGYNSKGLLESMLKGNTVENGCLFLEVEGVEISKGFRPPLLRGSGCRLELPEKWCSDFCGFLMCIVCTGQALEYETEIGIMKEEVIRMDSEIWEPEERSDEEYWTRVWYVSFDSLRHSLWWDPTCKALCFVNEGTCRGFGVRLVEKKSRSGLMETGKSTDSSSCNYAPDIKIKQDSTSALTISLTPYAFDFKMHALERIECDMRMIMMIKKEVLKAKYINRDFN